MIITAEIKNYEGNNVNTAHGKTYFISPMDIKAAQKNYPAGSMVTMTVEKGTVKGIAPAKEADIQIYKKEHQKPATPAKPSEFTTADKLMKPLVSETISDAEFEALKARADAAAAEKAHIANMEKISKEAKEFQENMKKRLPENQPAPKVEIPPQTLTKSQPAMPVEPYPDMEPEPVHEEVEQGPVELAIHIDMGSYTNFDLKISELTSDRAIARIETDAMKTIAMMRRVMSAAKKGY